MVILWHMDWVYAQWTALNIFWSVDIRLTFIPSLGSALALRVGMNSVKGDHFFSNLSGSEKGHIAERHSLLVLYNAWVRYTWSHLSFGRFGTVWLFWMLAILILHRLIVTLVRSHRSSVTRHLNPVPNITLEDVIPISSVSCLLPERADYLPLILLL